MMAQVRYIVDDVDAAVAFYTNAVGFTLVQQFGPAMAILELDGLRLWVAGPEASACRRRTQCSGREVRQGRHAL